MENSFRHTSVLLEEAVEGLDIKPSGLYVDGTLGGGGHSREIAKRLGEGGLLIGIDRDTDALRAAGEVLRAYEDRTELINGNYSQIGDILRSRRDGRADGILLDLGVSSFQLDTPSRGFTYRESDAPLDMRMDKSQLLTAEQVVNTYSEGELRRILSEYGEERFAGRIAERIVKERINFPIVTSGRLNDIIKEAIPAKQRNSGGHPSKRTFQAIRIEVNGELEALKSFLAQVPGLMKPGGRLSIITFHSLEDRLVKNAMKSWESPCTCPKSFPVCVCGKKPLGRIITRKPVLPGEEELSENRRSKSSKLRIFEFGENENV